MNESKESLLLISTNLEKSVAAQASLNPDSRTFESSLQIGQSTDASDLTCKLSSTKDYPDTRHNYTVSIFPDRCFQPFLLPSLISGSSSSFRHAKIVSAPQNYEYSCLAANNTLLLNNASVLSASLGGTAFNRNDIASPPPFAKFVASRAEKEVPIGLVESEPLVSLSTMINPWPRSAREIFELSSPNSSWTGFDDLRWEEQGPAGAFGCYTFFSSSLTPFVLLTCS